jgi:hypothetical protein
MRKGLHLCASPQSHFYDGNANGTPTLGLNNLHFDSAGWPYIR